MMLCLALFLPGLLSEAVRAQSLQARSLTGFRPLVLDNAQARWTPRTADRTPAIRYAFIAAPTRFDQARNCEAMTPIGPLLAKSRVAISEFRRETLRAFEMWEAVANLRFVETQDWNAADILIGAQQHPRGRAFTNVALQTGGKPAPGAIRQSLICLNPEMPWKIGFDGNLNAYDLRFTMAHEIGHAIGLDHPSASGQLMSYRYDEKHATLQPGDIAGAVAIYGRPRNPSDLRAANAKPGDRVVPPLETGSIGRGPSLGIGEPTASVDE